jgi:hypothetical protein
MTRHTGQLAKIMVLHEQGMRPRDIAEALGLDSGRRVSSAIRQKRERMAMPDYHASAPMISHWKGNQPPPSKTCTHWVQTPKGLKPCGAKKHQIDGYTMGKCKAHYEATRPLAGKWSSVA